MIFKNETIVGRITTGYLFHPKKLMLRWIKDIFSKFRKKGKSFSDKLHGK